MKKSSQPSVLRFSGFGKRASVWVSACSLLIGASAETPSAVFPDALRRDKPVEDIRGAVVYTMNELIDSDEGLALARQAGSDMLVRGWFKWGQAPHFERMGQLTEKAHGMGMLFGGGITCSALYHGENGLSENQVLGLATRGAEGQLIDAWQTPGCRHGSLSNPAYLDYLFSWCKQQIDGGVDYLFMDEINAALQPDEGFDDYAIADFRKCLLERYGKQGWAPNDPRWREVFKVDFADDRVASGHTMATFHYRAYLKACGFSSNPHDAANPFHTEWQTFLTERDDRAWKQLTDALRAYARANNRRVLISGNGLAPYVDLQIQNIWQDWLLKGDRIDFAPSQIELRRATVVSGWDMADKRVPVVFFHDWGFGGFPWMKISDDDRRLWIRIRGAEIYAAGGFFAFPVHGPGAFDSRSAGTLPEIIRQSAFYRRNKALYLDAEFLGFAPLESDQPDLSLALWKSDAPPQLMLHAINRQTEGDHPKRRPSVSVRLPVDCAPKSVRIVSPDWEGEKPGDARVENGRTSVTFSDLDAYAVAVLAYDALPRVKMSALRSVPALVWGRPTRNEFVVERDGSVQHGGSLPGYFQGNLHSGFRNPPTFLLDLQKKGCLKVHVMGVAMGGATFEWRVDDRVEKTVDLPDLDGKNDATPAKEYDQTFEFPVPAGKHRATLNNIGHDWASIGWYAFQEEE